MTVRGSEVVKVVPPVPPGSDLVTRPIRIEKRWFQGFAYIKLIFAILPLFPLMAILGLLIQAGVPVVGVLVISLLMVPSLLYILMIVIRTRPAVLEMDPSGVRLLRGQRVVKEINFGPHVNVGVIFVGYWDDLSPGLTLRAAGVDENDISLYNRQGFGPLFGYKIRGGGKKIVISKKHGWDLQGIQWLWMPLMTEVGRHRMQRDRSLEKYLMKRREMGLPAP
jgi:hypothetical protein